MKRGFFNASTSASCQTPLVRGPLYTLPAASTSKRVTDKGTMTVISASEEPLITPRHDYTVVEDDDPLILVADCRLEDAPYFGYFPPHKAVSEIVIIDHDLENIEDAAHWEAWEVPTFEDKTEKDQSFVVKAVEGKGMGMIATRDIKMGELIHRERPILVSIRTYNVAPDQGPKTGDFHRSALSRLGLRQQRAILALANCWDDTKDMISGIVATNYLPVEVHAQSNSPAQAYCGCFATLSRANHSCSPNTNYSYQFKDFSGQFYAVRDISAGEEITIAYCDMLQTQKDRKQKLFESYRFVCKCEVCSKAGISDRAGKSDAHRMLIKRIVDKLASDTSDRVELDELQRAILAADAEGLATYKAQLFYLGGATLLRAGTEKAAIGLSWLREARRLYEVLEGPASHHVAELKECVGC